MLKEASIVEDWVREGEERGEARGRALGEAAGELRGIRSITLDVLQAQFGELPPSAIRRVEEADAAWCRKTISQMLSAQSLEELGL